MIVQCDKCSVRFDDEFRSTICSHDPFPANDGRNNFALHPESYIDDPQHEANMSEWLASEKAEQERSDRGELKSAIKDILEAWSR